MIAACISIVLVLFLVGIMAKSQSTTPLLMVKGTTDDDLERRIWLRH